MNSPARCRLLASIVSTFDGGCAAQCTLMNPDTRRLIRMVFDPKDLAKVREIFEKLMDASEAEGRRNWMREHWKSVEADV